MPTLVWHYLTALLYYRTSTSCVALAEALKTVSHDRLTRLLQADWSGQRLLELAVRTLFVRERGYLLLDDTVMAKPFATAMESLAWVYSSQERRPVYGFSLVLLVWTNGTCRIPLGVRLWRKGGPSKYALALELLSYARNRLTLSPGLCALRCLVSLESAPQTPSGLWLVFCGSLEEESPLQWSRGAAPSAAPLLGRDRLAERRPESAGGQIRRQVLRHQSPDPVGRGGPSSLSCAGAD
jgi:hypothetical protein